MRKGPTRGLYNAKKNFLLLSLRFTAFFSFFVKKLTAVSRAFSERKIKIKIQFGGLRFFIIMKQKRPKITDTLGIISSVRN